MCTMIVAKAPIAGAGKSAEDWIDVDEATISYDHATHVWSEHSLRLDLFPTGAPAARRVAIELDLASGKRLIALLEEVIAAAERSNVG